MVTPRRFVRLRTASLGRLAAASGVSEARVKLTPERWRSLYGVAGHRSRQAAIGVGRIAADRKADAILMQERFQRGRRLGVVMLEDAMRSQDSDIIAAERLEHAVRLRQFTTDTAWTGHLKGVDDGAAAAQELKRQRVVGMNHRRDRRGRPSGSLDHPR